MKIHPSLPFALFCLAVSQPSHALDFTLRRMNGAPEGTSLSSSYITDGDNKILLRIPADWKAVDSPASLELIPAKPGCDVKISQVSAQALPLDAAGVATLQKQAESQIPKGAVKTTALPVANNVLPVYAWTSVEFTYRYEIFNQPMRRSVCYINMLPGRVVQWSVVAPDESFDAVHEGARVLMFHWFEPKRELPPEMARKYEAGEPQGG